jgi:hypothetical protein
MEINAQLVNKMYTIGYDELENLPDLKELILCPHCHKQHNVIHCKDKDGITSDISVYKCKKKTYLVGIKGKDISKTFKK